MAEATSGRSFSTKQIVAAVLVVVLVILAIVNAGKVEIDLVFTKVTAPLFLVIVGSAVIGWVVGWFMGRNRGD
ncbi:MAG: LapA family protein [Actinomycetota bacterium]